VNTTPVSLLLQVGRGDDPAAWPRLLDLLMPLLWQWAKRLNLREQDAEDLIQDVLLWLYQELPGFTYNPRRSFRALVWTIFKRRTFDFWRTRKPLSLESGTELSCPDVPSLEEDEYREVVLSRILTVIQTEFGEMTWRAFWEHVISDRPVAEVAAELGITKGYVYVAKARAFNRLRELRDLLD